MGRNCADLARKKELFLNLRSIMARKGASHEHKREEGCVGQGGLRFQVSSAHRGHSSSAVDVPGRSAAEKQNPCSFPSIHLQPSLIYPSSIHASLHSPFISLFLCPFTNPSSIYLSYFSIVMETERQWDSTAWFSSLRTNLSLSGADHGGNESLRVYRACRAWEPLEKARGQETSAKEVSERLGLQRLENRNAHPPAESGVGVQYSPSPYTMQAQK